eukprot:CAMPEP_0168164238 /NCGR_PEP_ID=MMETSP0139_2-20121125/828_1 /TAXON_ID=44445 /ORGANISM="Pseudo-nitzschia australis, Strain 10249 10 AB" /LENGTH=502 /DNA_ID=CAMNT_0008081237 /DNA_START=322 /DNA_END=1828 /DNA_ORIENTATION=-
MALWFYDPWLRRWSKRQTLSKPSTVDDSQSTSSSRWIASSPASSVLSQTDSILDRMMRWLQKFRRELSRFCFITIRTSEVILRISPLLILTPAALVSTHVLGSPMFSKLAWNYTIKAIQGLGPVAIKFCQWAATRRDIFPPTLCDQLSILHDDGYPHSWEWTHQVVTEAFGDYERKGLVIEEVIGCGSAAQVYRGTLTVKVDSTESKDCRSTREVAIKVLHPRFQEMVDRDLDFIEVVADGLNSLPIEFLKMLNLPRAVEEFSVVLRDQADLTTEAENLRLFRRNFFKDSQQQEERSAIIFPQPLDCWTSPSVIVEEYVNDAVPIADFLLDSSQEGMHKRKELAGPLLRAFLKMVFIDNFIHGDLHPGNVLVKTTLEPVSSSMWNNFWELNKTEGSPEENGKDARKIKRSIVFLDAGIAISLTPNDQRNLIDLFRAVVFNNGERAGRLMVERAKYERCSKSPGGIELFSEGIGEIVSEFHDRRKEGLTLGAVGLAFFYAESW